MLEGHAEPTYAWVEVAARTQTVVTISHAFARRGHHTLPALQVESRFPFGLFRAWSVWKPAGKARIRRPENQPNSTATTAQPSASNNAAFIPHPLRR